MRTYFFIAIVFMLLFCSHPAPGQQNNPDVNGTWNGTVSYFEKSTGMIGTGERHVDVTIVQNKVTGSHSYKSEGELGGIHGTTNCQGIEGGELHILTIRKWDSTYDIHIISPACTGTSTGATGPIPYGPEKKDIIISNKKYDSPDLLTGTETTVRELPGDLGKVTTTITWNLTNKPIDAELIVTPGDYDNWLPVPGKDELTKGSLMTISLKLRGKDGKPLQVKAKSFELRLSGTSKEPGITINFPLSPQANQLPDLRFLPTGIAESVNEDQFISIPCTDGSTGKGYIGSYDGGGWTTLTAEAILQDGTHIKGHLLVSGGEENILIPKRITPESKMAIAWVLANRNANGIPKDLDDKETSNGNDKKGDGLTAYEEYRGVISQGKFKRLDPNKKEVGIDVIKPELTLFSEGIEVFKNASGLTPVIFHEDLNEVGLDRRLNKNALTNHNYDQYVLRLENTVIPSKAIGKAYGGPAIPAKTFAVVIDFYKIPHDYHYWEEIAGEMHIAMPFTLKDFEANTIAHELGHGVNCWHHGEGGEKLPNMFVTKDATNYRIFSYDGTEITKPYRIYGDIGEKGTQESGDVSCVMAYSPYYDWAYSKKGDSIFYYQTPLIPLGKQMCNSKEDKKNFNKKDQSGNNNYFGDATEGNCLKQIKLRD